MELIANILNTWADARCQQNHLHQHIDSLALGHGRGFQANNSDGWYLEWYRGINKNEAVTDFINSPRLFSTFIQHFYDDSSQGPGLAWIRIFLLTSVQHELDILHGEERSFRTFYSSLESATSLHVIPNFTGLQSVSVMDGCRLQHLIKYFSPKYFPSHAILTTIVTAVVRCCSSFRVSLVSLLSSLTLFITTLTAV